MRRTLLVILVLAGCIKSSSVVCDDGTVCPESTVCDATHHMCVTPDQITECAGMPDLTACTLPVGMGACHDGVCLDAACGNGRLDPDEVCDDGNQIDGDGCSANCKSDESCGNGVIDEIFGEICDDANHLDHDGCSSSCQFETLNWVQIADPAAGTGMQAVYDAARGKVVMFGGTPTVPATASNVEVPGNTISEWDGTWHSNLDVPPPPARSRFAIAYDHDLRRTIVQGGSPDAVEAVRDTWAWDGARWTRLADGPAVIDAAMAYDAKRHKLVLFGGRPNASTNATDTTTWEFDGTSWAAASPVASPPARYGASMTYDPVRAVVVMYGGNTGLGFSTNDMWEYDGQTWTNRTPLPGPPAPSSLLVLTSLAYCRTLHRTVLYGGITDINGGGDPGMWLWDGTAWTAFAGATPPGRASYALTDDGHGGLIVFGGRNHLVPYGDTWLFDGTTWTQAKAPAARSSFGMATAFDQQAVVLFGGLNAASTALAETWELGPRGWKLGTAGPPATQFPDLVYDAARGQFVMFGGVVGAAPQNVTWLRTNGTWTQKTPVPSPPARVFHGMAYDVAHGVTVVFGGLNAALAPIGDTWTWDGTAWTQQTPMHSPSARGGATMAYDPVRGVVVLFGGAASGNFPSDTWIWDGADWTDASPAGDHPEYRASPILTWSPGQQALVLAGGSITTLDYFDAWGWFGSSTDPHTGRWVDLGTVSRPPGRAAHGGYMSPDGSGISIFGGRSTATGAAFGDGWELQVDGPRGVDSCRIAIDVDGDKLTECADPDCWRVCEPDCPPGASCPTTLPHCGDGLCGAFESCHTCPADCTSCAISCGDFVCDPGETCPGDCP